MENQRARIEVVMAPNPDAGQMKFRELHGKVDEKGTCTKCGSAHGYKFVEDGRMSTFLCLDCVVSFDDVIRVTVS